MRVAILETVKTQGGFEQEFDRLIIDELKKEGHEPVLYLPENSSLPVDFGIPIEYMSGGETSIMKAQENSKRYGCRSSGNGAVSVGLMRLMKRPAAMKWTPLY